MKHYLYDLTNGVIYRRPHYTSEQAMVNVALSLNKLYASTGVLFGTWDYSMAEGKRRGNAIADRLPYAMREFLARDGFGGTGVTW